MKQPFWTAAILGAALPVAAANIAENETQISARYGKTFGDMSTEAFGQMRGFQVAGYVIGVKFVDGASAMEMFSKADQSDMSASEIDSRLKANGGGAWKAEPVTGKPGWQRWRREDGALVALYDTGRHFLYISSKKFYEDQGKKIEASKGEKK